MNALDITGKDGRPAPVTDTLVVLTTGVSELLERGAGGDRTLKSDLMLVALPRVRAGDQAARAVPGWTATYPLDDPANEPDLPGSPCRSCGSSATITSPTSPTPLAHAPGADGGTLA